MKSGSISPLLAIMSGEDLDGTGLRSCLALDYNDRIESNNMNYDSDGNDNYKNNNEDSNSSENLCISNSKKNTRRKRSMYEDKRYHNNGIDDNNDNNSNNNNNDNSNIDNNNNSHYNNNSNIKKMKNRVIDNTSDKHSSSTKTRKVANFRKKTGDEVDMVTQALTAATTRTTIFQEVFKILIVSLSLLKTYVFL